MSERVRLRGGCRLTVVGVAVVAATCLGCGDGSTATPPDDATVDADEASTDTAGAEVPSEDAPDAAGETGSADGGAADGGAVDGGSTDSGSTDTGSVVDTGAPDVSFPCGTETCGKKFQICKRAPSPASCPDTETGPCPAGCPGCAELPYGCATLPGTCFSFPSCPCLLTVLCGGDSRGTCTEVDGAYTVACP